LLAEDKVKRNGHLYLILITSLIGVTSNSTSPVLILLRQLTLKNAPSVTAVRWCEQLLIASELRNRFVYRNKRKTNAKKAVANLHIGCDNLYSPNSAA